MANESLIVGNSNWAVKANNLLGYAVGETSGYYVPRELNFTRNSTATYTDENGIIQTAAANIARVQDNALLLEPQRTNLALYSEEFNDVAWGKNNLSVSANTTTSPDGTTNADSLIEDTANTFHQAIQNTSSAGGVYTATIYAKPNGRNWIAFNIAAAASYAAWFDIENGVVGTIQANITSATITSVGDGWYRCSITANTGALSPRISLLLSTGNNNTVYTGDGTSGVYIWGAQLEAGAYATSYIKTTSATVTRLADACSKTGISSLIGQTQGTIYLETKYSSLGSTAFESWFRVYGASDIIGLAINGANLIRSIINGKSDTLSTVAPRTNTGVKIAWAYNASGVVLFVNGVQYALPNGGAEVMSSLDSILFDASVNAFFAEGTISQAALFTTRLSNAELASMTTL